MDDIYNELSKPVWWVSVVMAGIAINLLSAYLKNPLDGAIARTFTWWRSRSIARKSAWEKRIERLRSSEEARTAAGLLEISFRLQSIHMLLLAIFILILPSVLPLIQTGESTLLPRHLAIGCFAFAALLFFVSFLAFMGSVTTRNALYEVRSKENPSINTVASR